MFADRDVKPRRPRSMLFTIVEGEEGFDIQWKDGRRVASLRKIKGKWHACCPDILRGKPELTYKMKGIWHGLNWMQDHYDADIHMNKDVFYKIRAISSGAREEQEAYNDID